MPLARLRMELTGTQAHADMTRRRFLSEASVGVLLGAAGTACSAEDGAFPSPTYGARRPLSVPGPMLPPVPAVWVTTNGREGDPDEISVLWSFVINGDPPQVGVAAGTEHVVGELIALHGEFVLNVPTADLVEQFDAVDMSSSRVADKFALAGLTRGTAAVVNAPTIEEAPIHLECRVLDSLVVPPMRTLYVAEVVATTALEGAVDDDGRLIVDNVPFFGMTAGSGEHWTMGREVGHIGMTVGRDDIRY